MIAVVYYTLAFHSGEPEYADLPSVDDLFFRYSQNNLWDIYIAIFGVI